MIKAATRENQVKLTVSVPPSLHVLLRSWALCEGRELTSVVLQCVELSIQLVGCSGVHLGCLHGCYGASPRML